MLTRGYWKIGSFGGAPIRVHWSFPLVAVLLALRAPLPLWPAIWAAFFLIILVHELGHAMLVRYFRHRLLAIDVAGYGGLCWYEQTATAYEQVVISWGGVLAQGVLLVLALVIDWAGGWVLIPLWGPELGHTLVWTNLLLIGLNLLPLPPLDGAKAWRIVRYLPDRLPGRWRRRQGQALLDELLKGREGASRQGATSTESQRARNGPASAPRSPGDGGLSVEAQRELADLLSRIGTEAGKVRRGGSDRS